MRAATEALAKSDRGRPTLLEFFAIHQNGACRRRPHPALRATFSRKAGEGERETHAPRSHLGQTFPRRRRHLQRSGRGVEVDVKPGLDKEELAKIIGDYDGLAIRSATKVTAKLLERATNLKVVGRAGIGVDNVDIPAATARGVIVMNTPFGNSITTAPTPTRSR